MLIVKPPVLLFYQDVHIVRIVWAFDHHSVKCECSNHRQNKSLTPSFWFLLYDSNICMPAFFDTWCRLCAGCCCSFCHGEYIPLFTVCRTFNNPFHFDSSVAYAKICLIGIRPNQPEYNSFRATVSGLLRSVASENKLCTAATPSIVWFVRLESLPEQPITEALPKSRWYVPCAVATYQRNTTAKAWQVKVKYAVNWVKRGSTAGATITKASEPLSPQRLRKCQALVV